MPQKVYTLKKKMALLFLNMQLIFLQQTKNFIKKYNMLIYSTAVNKQIIQVAKDTLIQ